jgi:tRNA A37 threonylcarbamoyladenosine dehydratase
MGTAGRLQPERLKLGTIWESRGCPLAKSLRSRLKHLGVLADFPVVWSDEPPVKPIQREIVAGAFDDHGTDDGITDEAGETGTATARGRPRLVQGSSPFVPQSAGHIMASWIVRQIISEAAVGR